MTLTRSHLICVLWVACGGSATPPPVPEPASIDRRPVTPTVEGEAIRAGVSYGPYRQGQSPDGAQPSEAEILEDLEIIAGRWHMIRVYSALGVTETILRVIRERHLPIRMMLGVWVDSEQSTNQRELEAAIRLANEYSEVVFAVCVGNETQVEWSGHRSPPDQLIALLRQARAGVVQPVATADDYNFWNKPQSAAVAAEIDFLVLHAYAMWNRQELTDAVSWTETQVEAIRQLHPELSVHLGETGWATAMHPTGDAARQIIAPAGEAEQSVFYREFTEWAQRAELPYFFFEVFDEPWKGGSHPDEVEKHWGLFNVDRTPKAAIRDLRD